MSDTMWPKTAAVRYGPARGTRVRVTSRQAFVLHLVETHGRVSKARMPGVTRRTLRVMSEKGLVQFQDHGRDWDVS